MFPFLVFPPILFLAVAVPGILGAFRYLLVVTLIWYFWPFIPFPALTSAGAFNVIDAAPAIL